MPEFKNSGRHAPGEHARVTRPAGVIHRAALALVWLTIVSGAVVFAEPAPVDLMMASLIIGLPVIGLTSFKPPLIWYFCLWLIIAAASFVAAAQGSAIPLHAKHSAITLFLALGMLVIAAFIARRPDKHLRLIMNAQLIAAIIAAIAGIIGYFDLLPGTHELFTKFGRAAGPFKDPNVFGPFIGLAALYALQQVLHCPLRKAALPLAMFTFLALGLLLSFSRGAWLSFGLAVVVFVYLSFVTARSRGRRLKLITWSFAALATIALAGSISLQFEAVSGLLEERASLTQSYDMGPDGRFGGQAKAVDLALDHPLGIGAAEFQTSYHHEDVHNVYLAMFLNAGWLGGLAYLLAIIIPAIFGLGHAFRRGRAQPLFLVVYAAFLGNAAEGMIIDTDHWRHFFLLIALVMGSWAASRRPAQAASRRLPRPATMARMVRPLPVPLRPLRYRPTKVPASTQAGPGWLWVVSDWRD